MGKVFDALKRAEEQRRDRLDEATTRGPDRTDPTPLESRFERPKRSPLWRRFLSPSPPRPQEAASALNKRRIALLQPQSFVAEQFRTLRGRLDAIAATRPLRSIAVTSAATGEGKTMTAVNLGIVMSMSLGQRVVLVDCDLRRPMVHDCLGLQVDMGLTEVLRGVCEPEDALVKVEGAALEVLPVRSLPPNPSELLASARMRELVGKLASRFDWVILDAPPVLGLPDAKSVSDLCDGILFVVRANATPREAVQASLEVLDSARLVGVVFNDAEPVSGQYGYSG